MRVWHSKHTIQRLLWDLFPVAAIFFVFCYFALKKLLRFSRLCAVLAEFSAVLVEISKRLADFCIMRR